MLVKGLLNKKTLVISRCDKEDLYSGGFSHTYHTYRYEIVFMSIKLVLTLAKSVDPQ